MQTPRWRVARKQRTDVRANTDLVRSASLSQLPQSLHIELLFRTFALIFCFTRRHAYPDHDATMCIPQKLHGVERSAHGGARVRPHGAPVPAGRGLARAEWTGGRLEVHGVGALLLDVG